MPLDAIIIAEAGDVGSADIIHERLRLDGRVATVQVIKNYLKHNGRVVPPVEGAGTMNWGAAYRLNGIYLLSYLLRGGLRVKLIDRYFKEKATFREMLGENPVPLSSPPPLFATDERSTGSWRISVIRHRIFSSSREGLL